jgi:hypothetical protein
METVKSILKAKRIAIIVLLGCVVSVSTSMSFYNTLIGKKAKDFVMEDQFSKEHSWEKFSGKPTVLLLGDREGSKFTDNWSKPLFARYGNTIHLVAMADVSSVPFFLKGFIRGKFRDAYTTPILMDWDGETVEYYDIQKNVPTFIAIDKQGIVRAHLSGKGTAEDLAKAYNAVQSILQ